MMKYSDPYLQNLSSCEISKLEELRADWGFCEQEFYQQISGWFMNFDSRDKKLAMKILENITFYSRERLEARMKRLFYPVLQFLKDTGRGLERVLIIVPEDRADSADMHAYNLTKNWEISTNQVKALNSNTAVMESIIEPYDVLIAFNDIHGTGKQFIRDIWTILENHLTEESGKTLFVISVSLAEKAKSYFEYKFHNKRVRIIPEETERSARSIFTVTEYERLEEIGRKVYPEHPLGYEYSGLLTAYYFQCPNNSLPLIWANGKNNGPAGQAYPWFPLFPYKSKVNTPKNAVPVSPQLISLDFPKKLKFKQNQKNEIIAIMSGWDIDGYLWSGGKEKTDNSKETSEAILRAENWLKNFKEGDEALVLKLIKNIRYLGITDVREMINSLRMLVMDDIIGRRGELSDVLLVLTGYEKPSVYNYVYDFMRIWNLRLNQIVLIDDIAKKEFNVLNKNLIYFYHTRSGTGRHFDGIWEKVKDLPVNTHYILSYSISEQSKEHIGRLKCDARIKNYSIYDEKQAIKTVFTSGEINRLNELCPIKTKPGKTPETTMENALLIAYYFSCSETSSPVLNRNTDGWNPLFNLNRITN